MHHFLLFATSIIANDLHFLRDTEKPSAQSVFLTFGGTLGYTII